MSNSVPVYVVRLHSDERNHIVIGKEINTLCDSNKVESALQVPSNSGPESLMENNQEFCEECIETWNEVQIDIGRELTTHCFICENTVSRCLAREVEHMTARTPEVCKSCYNKLYRDEDSNIDVPYEDSNIDVPYEESEPAFNMHGDRTYNK